ncbi:MAG: hypothetical protein J6R18_05915, partial [Kiritimatiellae bacterium]|nr:hypothetical protein [Kiritimatiellia bacterium]
IENIHKVIDPLFLDDLTRRVDEILGDDFSRKERKEHVDVEIEEDVVNPQIGTNLHKSICGDKCGFVDYNSDKNLHD